MASLLAFVNSPIGIIPTECVISSWDFYQSQFLQTLGPLFVVLILFCLSRKPRVRAGAETSFKLSQRIITQSLALRCTIFLAFLVLPSTSLCILQLFVCSKFADGSRYLEAE